MRWSRSKAYTAAEPPRLAIVVGLDSDGCLSRFEAGGHAGTTPRGSNIACSAATGLLRTAARLLSSEGLVEEGGAEAPGRMSVKVSRRREAGLEWLRGVTDFLLRGLRDLEAEFPREIVVRFDE